MNDRPPNSLTGTAPDLVGNADFPVGESFALPHWFIQEVMRDLKRGPLVVMVGMCRHRRPDGRTYWNSDAICRETGIGKTTAAMAIRLLLAHPRRLLVEHAPGVFTAFPDEVWPGDPAGRFVPPIKPAPNRSERAIQLAIADDIRSSVVVAVPNYTPVKWWEADLWAVTKAGYAVEYEIKVSLADFKGDTKKASRIFDPDAQTFDLQKKHDRLAACDPSGPSRFFYVVPVELRSAVEARLPAWAGLGLIQSNRVRFVKQAPTLHRVKVGRREIQLALRRMWYRYWQAIRDVERLSHGRGA